MSVIERHVIHRDIAGYRDKLDMIVIQLGYTLSYPIPGHTRIDTQRHTETHRGP